MNNLLNEYFGLFELNIELNHFLARFNVKMNNQNVSATPNVTRVYCLYLHLGKTKPSEVEPPRVSTFRLKAPGIPVKTCTYFYSKCISSPTHYIVMVTT